MKIRTEIFLNPFYDCDDQPGNPVCKAATEGIFSAESQRAKAGLDSAFAGLSTIEYSQNGDLERSLGITRQPTLIFFDESGDIALARLQKGQITKAMVEKTYTYLSSLEPAGSGEYITPDGGSITNEELWQSNDGSWFGMGLGFAFGGCPKWMPKIVCNLPIWLALIVLLLIILITLKIVK